MYFPDTVSAETPIKYHKTAVTKYRDYTIRREDPRGVPYYWIWGQTHDLPEDTDSYAVLKQKVISITPITLYFDARDNSAIKTALAFLERD